MDNLIYGIWLRRGGDPTMRTRCPTSSSMTANSTCRATARGSERTDDSHTRMTRQPRVCNWRVTALSLRRFWRIFATQ